MSWKDALECLPSCLANVRNDSLPNMNHGFDDVQTVTDLQIFRCGSEVGGNGAVHELRMLKQVIVGVVHHLRMLKPATVRSLKPG